MALLLPAFAAVLTAVTAGVLSPELAAARTVPLYDLAQSVSLFGVVERIEPLLSAAMTMGVFALLSALACAGQALADTLWPWTWSGSAVCAAAAGMMYLTRNVPPEVLTAGAVVFWFAVPVATVGVVRIRRKDE